MMPSTYDSYDEGLSPMRGGAPSPLLIANGELRIRPLAEDDLEALAGWLADERVLEFYEGRDTSWPPDKVRTHFFEKPACGDDFLRVAIEWRGAPIGYGQVYRVRGEIYEEYDCPDMGKVVYAMDQFIGEPEYWNRGIGSSFLLLLADYLKNEKQAERILLDPRKANPRAIRAYEKAGFHIVKSLPAHELFEGKNEDCWLMEKAL